MKTVHVPATRLYLQIWKVLIPAHNANDKKNFTSSIECGFSAGCCHVISEMTPYMVDIFSKLRTLVDPPKIS